MHSDATAYEFTELPRYPDLFFDDGRYLLADCAYPLKPRIITGFPENKLSVPENKAYHDAQVNARAVIENMFADLKNKFQGLGDIPLEVETEENVGKVVKWCMACAVLYNFVLLCDAETDEIVDLSNNFYEECGPRLEQHERRYAENPQFVTSQNTGARGVERRAQTITTF
ncbi:hypothetical protein BGZ73_008708 [Actinomortierella ambigua]|nr:hypothetical protein BGZ73_008708 [Actinomortierella ambigua]